jgi:hypothetical protein
MLKMIHNSGFKKRDVQIKASYALLHALRSCGGTSYQTRGFRHDGVTSRMARHNVRAKLEQTSLVFSKSSSDAFNVANKYGTCVSSCNNPLSTFQKVRL